MSLKLRSILAFTLLLASIFYVIPAHAAGNPVVSAYTLTCSSFSASGNIPQIPGSMDSMEIRIRVTSGGTDLTGAVSHPLGSGFTFNFSQSFPAQPVGTSISIQLWDSTGGASWIHTAACANSVSGSSSAVQSFDPGDGRFDGRPGDRIVVWCNADNLDVWGIGRDSRGFRLVSFTTLELAYGVVLSRNLGTNGNVTLTPRGQNSYMIAWSGGTEGANGIGDFLKIVTCHFK